MLVERCKLPSCCNFALFVKIPDLTADILLYSGRNIISGRRKRLRIFPLYNLTVHKMFRKIDRGLLVFSQESVVIVNINIKVFLQVRYLNR